MTHLTSKTLPINILTDKQKDKMFEVLEEHYANSFRSEFNNDLSEKDLVILLSESDSEEIAGFSTQKIFDFNFDNEDITIVFSGDTIIKKEYWGSLELSVAFGKMMLEILNKNKSKKLYWMLISKGFRTYKFLPVFFHKFYPDYKQDTPEKIQLLMHQLGKYKFDNQYNSQTGIVKAKNKGQFLKLDFQPELKNNNEYACFFKEKNPEYQQGDELLCLTLFSLENLKPFIKRVLKID